VVLRDALRIEVKRRAAPCRRHAQPGWHALRDPGALRHLSEVHVRYARWDFSRVDLVDPRTGAILCPITPLDKAPTPTGSAAG
jgi:putative transposase